jgi:hypothetical protein
LKFNRQGVEAPFALDALAGILGLCPVGDENCPPSACLEFELSAPNDLHISLISTTGGVAGLLARHLSLVFLAAACEVFSFCVGWLPGSDGYADLAVAMVSLPCPTGRSREAHTN